MVCTDGPISKNFFHLPANAPKYSASSPFFHGCEVSISDPHSRIVTSFKTNITRCATGHQDVEGTTNSNLSR